MTEDERALAIYDLQEIARYAELIERAWVDLVIDRMEFELGNPTF